MSSAPILVDPSQVTSAPGAVVSGVDPSQVSAPAAPNPDAALAAPLNYHTGHPMLDLPLGLLQGAAKGALSTATGIQSMIQNLSGQPQTLTPQQRTEITAPNGIGQGTGKFLEQAGEFAGTAALGGEALEGAPLAAKLLGQAAISGSVSAAQTGGDIPATVTGAVLGGTGELGPAVKAIRSAAENLAPTFQNFSNAFAATPLQKAVIAKALPTLTKDGIAPAGSPAEMQAIVKNRLADLGSQYDLLRANGVGDRPIDPQDVISGLQRQLQNYQRNGTTISANAPEVAQINKQIEDVTNLWANNNGSLTVNDLRHLADGANKLTDFSEPKWSQTLGGRLGGVYRDNMQAAAPETTGLNQDYAQYKQLEALSDKNMAMGRGTTQSGLDALLDKAKGAGVGMAIGEAAGHATGIPFAGELGGLAGMVALPKLSAPIVQALRNASDAGVFNGASAASKRAMQLALQTGNEPTIRRALSAMTKESTTSTIAQ